MASLPPLSLVIFEISPSWTPPRSFPNIPGILLSPKRAEMANLGKQDEMNIPKKKIILVVLELPASSSSRRVKIPFKNTLGMSIYSKKGILQLRLKKKNYGRNSGIFRPWGEIPREWRRRRGMGKIRRYLSRNSAKDELAQQDLGILGQQRVSLTSARI